MTAPTAAQAARQDARHRDGRYSEMHRTEGDLHPDTDPQTDETEAGEAAEVLTLAEVVHRYHQPSADITKTAVDRHLNDLDLPAKFGWDALMGRRTRRTEANLAAYRQRKLFAIHRDPQWRQRFRDRADATAGQLLQHQAVVNAHEAGQPTELDAHFDAIWEGRAGGINQGSCEATLAGHRSDLEGLAEGTIKPRQIVGTGYRNPKKVAAAWLEQQIAEAERALATRGRSSAVNYSNVLHQLRTQQAETPGVGQ